MTLFRAKSDLPHEITFGDKPRVFKIMWSEKKLYCKIYGTVHMLSYDCRKKNLDNSTRPPNVDGTVSVSRMKTTRLTMSSRNQVGMDLVLWTHWTNPWLTLAQITHKCIIGPIGHGYPGVIEKASQSEELPTNQGDSRTHIEPNRDNLTEKCQIDLPNQDSETKPKASPSWGDSSNGMTSGLKSSHDFIDTRLTSQEDIDLIINSRVALEGKVPYVSLIDDETPGNCSQTLEKINSDIPFPADETSRTTESLPPIPHSN